MKKVPIMPTVEAVVFDIGNVLLEWQPERHYNLKFGEAHRKKLFDAVDLHGMNEAVDRGTSLRDATLQVAGEHPEYAAEIHLWHDEWMEMIGPVISHSVNLLRALRRKGVPVFALSNFGVETFAMAEAKYDFLGEFDRRYISGHMRVTKPGTEIYAQLETDSRVAPEGLLFTDDRQENIDTAAARGWQTHVFEGPEGLARALVERRVLTAEEAET